MTSFASIGNIGLAGESHRHRVELRDLNYWDYLAILSGTITLVAALGTWVFRWWD